MTPVDPKQYVARFANELDLSNESQNKANEIIDVAVADGLLSGKSPTGFAAVALYAANILCNERRTQETVSSVAQVSAVNSPKPLPGAP